MKKRILFSAIIFTLLNVQVAFAQTNLDSLYTVWQNSSQPDTVRVQAYHDYIWGGFLFTDPDSAFSLAEQMLTYGQEQDLPFAKAIALKIQGISYYVQGKYPKALDYYNLSIKFYEEIGDEYGIAKTLGNNAIIYTIQGDFLKALKIYSRCIEIFEQAGDKSRVAAVLGNVALIYDSQGIPAKALDYHLRSLKIREEIGDRSGIATVLNNIGTLYSSQGNYALALDYYARSLKINEGIEGPLSNSSMLVNIGNVYSNEGNYAKALEFFNRALKEFEEVGVKKEIARTISNIGFVYLKQEEYTTAKDYFQRSLVIQQEIADIRSMALTLNYIGEMYQKQGKNQDAMSTCLRALELSEEIGFMLEQRRACLCLYATYKAMGKGNEALVYMEKMRVLEDSLNAEETNQNLQQMEFAKEVLADSLATAEETRLVEEAHQEEVRQKNQTRNALAGAGFLVLLLAGGIYSRLRYVRKSKAIIEEEKDRSNNLLLNILPADIAEELKIHGKAEARDFDMVSILFTDFKGFTAASEKLSAQDLVAEINTCFEAFDGIMGKYNIEKIKTIGDAYMAAGGLPVPTDDSVKNTVLASLEMQDFISKRKTELDSKGLPAFEMRVGIHTGPVVAGIVGVKKFQYDIWGDTVNTAARMESNGQVEKVNISQTTYELLKEDADFTFESRGKIEAKGKGEIDMYFVSKT